MLKMWRNPSKTLKSGKIVEICYFNICQFFPNQKYYKKYLTFCTNVVQYLQISTIYGRRSTMRLVIQGFRHLWIQFSMITLITMVYFLLVRMFI